MDLTESWDAETMAEQSGRLVRDAPTEPDDGLRFALLRLDDRIDLALTVGQDGRCTVPVKGLYSLGRVTTLKEAADAERAEQVMKRVRHGVMTISQAKQMLTRRWDEVPVD